MKKLGEHEDAASPVVGVMSMLTLTVIMVSVVVLSVLSFALPQSTPHAKIVIVEAKGDTDTALRNNTIVLRHKGGDSLNENNTRIIITGKGYAYTGTMPSGPAIDMRATYTNSAGENCIVHCDNEIVMGDSWDAGETITLYGSDGRALDFYGWHNNADSKWKIDDGSTVSVTIIDTDTNQIIAASQATVKDV